MLVVLVMGVAVRALMIAVTAHPRLAGVQARDCNPRTDGEKDVVAVLADQCGEITQAPADVEKVRAQLAGTGDDVKQSLCHVAVRRYDAFSHMGGRLCFSAAILDLADGLVVSSIQARGESRAYAKGVVEGDSEATLSPQEQQAIADAPTRKDAS